MTEQRRIAGSWWPLLQRCHREALASGALQPIETAQTLVDDRGVRFVIRVAANLARKAAVRERQDPSQRASGPPPNPFLPYEPALFVADLTDTHLALLNKFNVLDHHLLIVTRRFVHQETLLDEADFTALSLGMADHTGLGFYNGGAVAGASQSHKHLQWLPLPLAESGPAVPIAPLLPTARRAGEVGVVPGLPFRHAFVALNPALIAEVARIAALAPFRHMLTPSGHRMSVAMTNGGALGWQSGSPRP